MIKQQTTQWMSLFLCKLQYYYRLYESCFPFYVNTQDEVVRPRNFSTIPNASVKIAVQIVFGNKKQTNMRSDQKIPRDSLLRDAVLILIHTTQ